MKSTGREEVAGDRGSQEAQPVGAEAGRGTACERRPGWEHGMLLWNTLPKHTLLDTAPTTYCAHLSVSSPDYFLITKYKKNSAGSQSPDPFHQRPKTSCA